MNTALAQTIDPALATPERAANLVIILETLEATAAKFEDVFDTDMRHPFIPMPEGNSTVIGVAGMTTALCESLFEGITLLTPGTPEALENLQENAAMLERIIHRNMDSLDHVFGQKFIGKILKDDIRILACAAFDILRGTGAQDKDVVVTPYTVNETLASIICQQSDAEIYQDTAERFRTAFAFLAEQPANKTNQWLQEIRNEVGPLLHQQNHLVQITHETQSNETTNARVTVAIKNEASWEDLTTRDAALLLNAFNKPAKAEAVKKEVAEFLATGTRLTGRTKLEHVLDTREAHGNPARADHYPTLYTLLTAKA